MPPRRVAAVVVIVTLVIAAAVVVRGRPPAQAPPPPAAFGRLVRADGTLFWTVNRGDEHSVYAMTPPGPPRLLHREHGGMAFAALVARPSPAFVIHETAGSSSIHVLSPARRILAPRPIGGSDLLVAGSHLLWADDRGIRSMPAGGGTIRTLVREMGVGDLALGRGRLFYVADGRTVRSVAVTGGVPKVELRAANTVTAICVGDRLYWSELGVTVRSKGRVHWTGRLTTALSCSPNRLAWSDCPPRHGPCRVLVEDGRSFRTGAWPRDIDDNGVDFAHLTGDGPAVRSPASARS
jgi:hypothetical protein